MTTISQAALAASVVVGMISLPAVSEPAAPTQQLPETSDSTPSKEVVRQSTPEGFRAKISTAFEDFRTSIGSSSANASLESSQARLEVHRRPSSTEWVLTAPAGRLTLERTPTSVVETVETPSGTLQTVREDGAVTSRFEGSNRSRVEKSAETLRDTMESKKSEMDTKRKQVSPIADQLTGEIEIVANDSTASGFGNNDKEHVILKNGRRTTVDLEDMTLSNDNPDTYTFGEVELEPGESLSVYSKEVDSKVSAVEDTGLSWANGGDTAKLLEDDKVIAERSY